MSNGKTILVVDDDVDLLEQVSSAMTARGFEVVTAGGQEEAADKLLSVRPDLAIVDLMMERSDSGFVLCHELKQLYPKTPVILLTAVTAATGMRFGSEDGRERAWIQADALLDKPVRPETLAHEVERLLHGAAVASA
jgi:CheY-like chemotaxis protein